MGTISLTLPSDGQTIDAADVNTPFNTISTVINGNIDSNNISAGGITPANLVSGTGTSWAWQSWTPTWTNLTVGNATQASKYTQIGKTVIAEIQLTLGSTSTVGTSPTFTLPVTSVSYVAFTAIGVCILNDVTGSVYQAAVSWSTTTTAELTVANASGTYIVQNGITSTVPFTWTTSDRLTAHIVYEAA